MVFCRSLTWIVTRYRLDFILSIKGNRFTTSVTSFTNSFPLTVTHDIVKNHSEWPILLNYLKYLSNRPIECKFDKCVNILINVGDRVLQYNKKCGLSSGFTSKWEWNKGVLRSVPGVDLSSCIGEDLTPPVVLNLIKMLSKMRIYWRINNHTFENKLMTTNKSKREYLFSDIIDDLDANSFKLISSKFKKPQIGPLRYDSEGFMAYPSILSNPFLFELTDLDFFNKLEQFRLEFKGDCGTKTFSYFIDTVMSQFLDQLFILISNSEFTGSMLCVMSMYLSIMVYGSKLSTKNNCKISDRIESSLNVIHKYVCDYVKSVNCDLSLRSLAYLLNSVKNSNDLLKCVSERIKNYDGPMNEDYLENFCYSFTRNYYNDDDLYRKFAHLINVNSANLSLVVTINFILSFSRINKLDLVKHNLFSKLSSFTGRDFKKCSNSLLQSLFNVNDADLQLILNKFKNILPLNLSNSNSLINP